MRRLSEASAKAYTAATGFQFAGEVERGGAAEGGRNTIAAAPTLRRVSGPEEDIEAAVALLDEATPHGRARNRWLSRGKARQLGLGDDGQPLLEGRTCCLQLAMQIDRYVHRERLPFRRVCPGCGTTWAVEMAPREERRHVWNR